MKDTKQIITKDGKLYTIKPTKDLPYGYEINELIFNGERWIHNDKVYSPTYENSCFWVEEVMQGKHSFRP